jgi:hypothetical protein
MVEDANAESIGANAMIRACVLSDRYLRETARLAGESDQTLRSRIRLSGRGPVQGHSRTYERLEGIPIYFTALMEIYSAPGVALKTRVEQT